MAVFAPVVVFANTVPPPATGGGSVPPPAVSVTFQNPLKAESLACLLADIFQIIVNIGAVVATLYIIYAGFLYVTARGDEKQIKDARSALTNAVIGTALLLGAWALATVIATTISKVTSFDPSGTGSGFSCSSTS